MQLTPSSPLPPTPLNIVSTPMHFKYYYTSHYPCLYVAAAACFSKMVYRKYKSLQSVKVCISIEYTFIYNLYTINKQLHKHGGPQIGTIGQMNPLHSSLSHSRDELRPQLCMQGCYIILCDNCVSTPPLRIVQC